MPLLLSHPQEKFHLQIKKMQNKEISWLISAIATVTIILHIAFPDLKIDSITVALLLIGIAPWISPIFKSLEVPGLKLEFQDFERIENQAEKIGMLATPPTNKEKLELIEMADEDSTLALAGLRIQIERKLRAIANKHGIVTPAMGANQLLNKLSKDVVLDPSVISLLKDLINNLNKAIHGVEVSKDIANWAIEVGPKILAALDKHLYE